jgi:hypothetical protein
MLKRLLIAPVSAAVLGLVACTGQDFALLPAGAGSYSGDFSAGGADNGDLTLRIRDSGQLSGSGDVAGFTIELRGVLHADGRLEGFITESVSQRSGEFNGQLAGTQLSGDWRFDPSGSQVLQGAWTAALNP